MTYIVAANDIYNKLLTIEGENEMVNDNHELLLEIWSRIKAHIPPKARLEVADTLVVVFDEFGLVDEQLIDEDLDKELRAAALSHLANHTEGSEDHDDDSYGF